MHTSKIGYGCLEVLTLALWLAGCDANRPAIEAPEPPPPPPLQLATEPAPSAETLPEKPKTEEPPTEPQVQGTRTGENAPVEDEPAPPVASELTYNGKTVTAAFFTTLSLSDRATILSTISNPKVKDNFAATLTPQDTEAMITLLQERVAVLPRLGEQIGADRETIDAQIQRNQDLITYLTGDRDHPEYTIFIEKPVTPEYFRTLSAYDKAVVLKLTSNPDTTALYLGLLTEADKEEMLPIVRDRIRNLREMGGELGLDKQVVQDTIEKYTRVEQCLIDSLKPAAKEDAPVNATIPREDTPEPNQVAANPTPVNEQTPPAAPPVRETTAPVMQEQVPQKAAPDPWFTDLDAARKEAEKSHRNILLIVTDPQQSELCERMEMDVFSDKTYFLQRAQRFVLVKQDLAAVRQAAQANQPVDMAFLRRFEMLTPQNQLVEVIGPHVWLLDSQGRPCGRYVCSGSGDRSASDFLSKVRQLETVKDKRDASIQQAEAAQDLDRARFLHEALSTIGSDWIVADSYPDLTQRIIDLDPDNQAGLRDQYRRMLLARSFEALIQQQQWADLVGKLDEYFNCHPTDAQAKEPYLYRFQALFGLQRFEDALSAADDYLQRYEPKEFTRKTRPDSERAVALRGMKIQIHKHLRQWPKVVAEVDQCLTLYRYNLDKDTQGQLFLTKSMALLEMGRPDEAEDALCEAPSSLDDDFKKEEVRLATAINQTRIDRLKARLAEQSVPFAQYNGRTVLPSDFNDLKPEAQYAVLKDAKNDDLRTIYALSLNEANNRALRDHVDRQSVSVSPDQTKLTPAAWKQVNHEYVKVRQILDLTWEEAYWSREANPHVDMFLPNDWVFTADPNRLPNRCLFYLKPRHDTEYSDGIQIFVYRFTGDPLSVDRYKAKYESDLNSQCTVLRKETLTVRSLPAFGYDLRIDGDRPTYVYRVCILGPRAGIEVDCLADSAEGLDRKMPLFREFVRRLVVHGAPATDADLPQHAQ